MIRKFLLGLALAVGLASPVLAQNPTCPTRPIGDNTNACASTAFVQTATGGITIPEPPNTFFAGPVSGPPSNPTFRAIDPADLMLNGLRVALRTTGGNTYYASPTGVDLNNSCLSSLAPCTGQGAVNQAQYFNDAQGGSPSIQLLDGTYVVPDSAIFMLFSGAAVGIDKFAVTGNCGSPGSVIISLGNASIGISAQDLGIAANITCLTIKAGAGKTGGAALYSYQHGVMDVGTGVHFGGIPGGNHMLLDFDGKVNVVDTYTIDPGTTANHVNATNGSRISFGGATVNCNGVTPPTFTNFLALGPGSIVVSPNPASPTVFNCGGTTAVNPYFINGGVDYSQINWPGAGVTGQYNRFFEATLPGNQTTIADATTTKLTFVANASSSGSFSAGTWSPARGISDLTCSANWLDAADGDFMQVAIYKNNSPLAATGDPVAANATTATKAVNIKDATVLGDAYDCRVFLQHGSGTHTVTAGFSTIFSGVLLGD